MGALSRDVHVGNVQRLGQGLIVQDTEQDPRFYSKVDEATGYKTRAIACAPIRARGKVIGVL
ncbi:MAG: GAF domain-containing protein, partial [Nitrospirales bacterium]